LNRGQVAFQHFQRCQSVLLDIINRLECRFKLRFFERIPNFSETCPENVFEQSCFTIWKLNARKTGSFGETNFLERWPPVVIRNSDVVTDANVLQCAPGLSCYRYDGAANQFRFKLSLTDSNNSCVKSR
jgi:hypothetical protein